MEQPEISTTALVGTYTERTLGGLVRVLADLAAQRAAQVAEMAEILLHHPPRAPRQSQGASDLNSNGSPLQGLLSARRDRWEIRLIADPAFYHADPLLRWRGSRPAMDAALHIGAATALQETIARTLAAVVPADIEAQRAYPTGMVRLAVALAAPGAAVYAGLGSHPAPWRAARRWAEQIFSNPARAQQTLTHLEESSRLFGVGIEGASPARCRAKVYWRLRHPASLASFGIPLFETETIVGFLHAMMRHETFPIQALNFSAGFDLTTGALEDIKVDVCNGSARLDLAAALGLVNAQARSLGLDPPAFADAPTLFARHGIAVGCLGLGLDRHGGHRLNTYIYQSHTERRDLGCGVESSCHEY